jgi:hypothetical protein
MFMRLSSSCPVCDDARSYVHPVAVFLGFTDALLVYLLCSCSAPGLFCFFLMHLLSWCTYYLDALFMMHLLSWCTFHDALLHQLFNYSDVLFNYVYVWHWFYFLVQLHCTFNQLIKSTMQLYQKIKPMSNVHIIEKYIRIIEELMQKCIMKSASR